MKYFSVAIVAAFLCAAVVSAAPSSPNPTFEELASDQIHLFEEQFMDFYMDLRCIRDVVEKEVKKSDIADRWERMREEFERYEEKWTKCNKRDNVREKMECRMKVLRKGAEYFKEFMRKMARDHKELFERIRDKVADKCMNRRSFLEETGTRASLPDQMQCMIDVLGKISKENGMEEAWSKTQPEFDRHIKSWRECPNAGNKIMVILCNIREGINTFKVMAEYMQKVAAKNPKLLEEFNRRVQQECQGQKAPEEDEFAALLELEEEQDASERLKCIGDAIRDAVKETNWEEMGNKLKEEMQAVGERMKACKTEQDKWAAAKCIRKELGRAREILMDFFRRLGEANRKTWERMRALIKERCSA